MSTNFHLLSNALRRAIEFEEVGKPRLALETLHEVLVARKHRTWAPTHEQIMCKFLDLCMSLKRGLDAKDGLHQFKNITGVTNVGSYEKIIKYYLGQAETKVEDAWKKTRGAVHDNKVNVEDLEEAETPESVLLAAVSVEGSQERLERVELYPWLKYLWEAYRTVLDLLRNNNKLEVLYHLTSRQAFKFCIKYDRRQEFRRLCDLLRYHLSQLQLPPKGVVSATRVDLKHPDTIRLSLETRFELVSAAAKLELWQEAFRGMEDVSSIMDLSATDLPIQVLGVYYHKLAQIFWRSKDYAFHATAWQRFFQLAVESPNNFKTEEIQLSASSVLLSTLTIPLAKVDTFVKPMDGYAPEFRENREVRLGALVGELSEPSRGDLISAMNDMNIMQYVNPKLKDLFSLLEQEFHPLQLCQKTEPIIEFIREQKQFAQYVRPLQYVITMRLLKQLSQLYTTLKLDSLCQLLPFWTKTEIEQYLIQAVTDKVLSLRINHRSQTVHCNINIFSQSNNNDGPQLQSLVSEMTNGQLTVLSRRLHEAMNMLDPSTQATRQQARKSHILSDIQSKITYEHHAILERKITIEARKEAIENAQQQRRVAEQQAAILAAREARRAETERLEAEARKREEDRRKRELDEIAQGQAIEKVNQLKKTAQGAKTIAKISEEALVNMNVNDIEKTHSEFLAKEKREQQEKLRALEKRIDYMERAKRLKEIPKLKALSAKQADQNLKWFQEQQAAKIEKSKQEHILALELKAVLKSSIDAKEKYVQTVLEKRRMAYAAAFSDFRRRLASQEIAMKKAEEERQRKMEEERQEAERREAERALREEEERKQRAAEEALIAEERKKRAEEDAIKQKKLDEIARRQQQRELEVTAKMQPAGAAPSAWRPGGATSTWRNREQDISPQNPPSTLSADTYGQPDARRRVEESTWRSTPRTESAGDPWRSRRTDAPREAPAPSEPWRTDSGSRARGGPAPDRDPRRDPLGGAWRRDDEPRDTTRPGGPRSASGGRGGQRSTDRTASDGRGGPRSTDRTASGGRGGQRSSADEGNWR